MNLSFYYYYTSFNTVCRDFFLIHFMYQIYSFFLITNTILLNVLANVFHLFLAAKSFHFTLQVNVSSHFQWFRILHFLKILLALSNVIAKVNNNNEAVSLLVETIIEFYEFNKTKHALKINDSNMVKTQTYPIHKI